MMEPFRTSPLVAVIDGAGADHLRQYSAPEPAMADCSVEPRGLTYRQARDILYAHEVHGPQCRQWLAAAAYLSAGLDDE
ncbi:hypothetical protein [Nocardia implantans]|uniref:Uncharacterized protein n=1 Tax=Nocardia implantans TaxID=3108168 RepID=A0ABU6ARS9_9NOCA|nr:MULTISPECIES: hypothetical protein [unclassified Nocardia]MBF6191481.1 hypothetical protein [Nocardia beijingensis]MEA3528212.1 hypothetical protein [Nocardia sp. CDC192]MEB3510038.1 hypothetical protein [Nocardia sp. CDC186]